MPWGHHMSQENGVEKGCVAFFDTFWVCNVQISAFESLRRLERALRSRGPWSSSVLHMLRLEVSQLGSLFGKVPSSIPASSPLRRVVAPTHAKYLYRCLTMLGVKEFRIRSSDGVGGKVGLWIRNDSHAHLEAVGGPGILRDKWRPLPLRCCVQACIQYSTQRRRTAKLRAASDQGEGASAQLR